MNLSGHFIRKSLFFEISFINGKNEVKLWVVNHHKNGMYTEQKTYNANDSPEKWKHNLAILSIHGEQVISKLYPKEDIALKKITENNDLLWSVIPSQINNECTVSFIRKDNISNLINQLDKNDIYILDTWISRNEIPDKEKQISIFYEREMGFSVIKNIPGRANLLSNVIYYKLRLPILLLFFSLLLGNFFINTHLRNEYENIQTELNIKRRNDRSYQENQKKLNRIQTEFQKIPECSFAFIADRIASYLPANIHLNYLSVFPPENKRNNILSRHQTLNLKTGIIIVKGEVETPGSVTLFAQLLSHDNLFSKVEVVSLTRQKDSTLFNFEVQMTL